MRINKQDYELFISKANDFYKNILKTTYFEYKAQIKKAIKWFSNTNYDTLCVIADSNKVFENTLFNSITSLEMLFSVPEDLFPDKDKIMVAVLDFNTLQSRLKDINEDLNSRRTDKAKNQLRDLENQIVNFEKHLNKCQENAKAMIEKAQKEFDKYTLSMKEKNSLAEKQIDNIFEKIKNEEERFSVYKSNFGSLQHIVDDEIQKIRKQCSADIIKIVNEEKNYFSKEKNKIQSLQEDLKNEFNELQNRNLNEIKKIYINKYNGVLSEFEDDKEKKLREIENFKIKVNQELRSLQNDIFNEQLAKYFLKEHDKLKGNISWNTKNEILTPYWCWLGLTFAGMGFICYFAKDVYDSQALSEWQQVFSRLPLFTILIWFTWFCSKQFSYIKQICDEYEYKYALSKS